MTLTGLEQFTKPKSPVKIIKGFLSRHEADALFRALEAGHWDTLTVPQYNITAKRKTVTHYEGDEEAANKYMNKFGDKGIHAVPYTQAPAGLRALREILRRKYGLEFSLCYINYYKDALTQIGWHRDREESESPDPLVMVCLGGTRTFSIWKIKEGEQPKAEWEEITECGDLVEMPIGFHAPGMYKHAVLPQRRFAAPRISVTFRNRVSKSSWTFSRQLENWQITPSGRALIHHRFWLSALYWAFRVVTPRRRGAEMLQ